MLRFLLALVAFGAVSAYADFDQALDWYQHKDYARAFVEFQRLAALGDHAAQFNLGVMYYRGENTAGNLIDGYAWMALACQDGAKDWSAIRDKVFASFNPQQQAQAAARRDALLQEFGDKALSRQWAPVLVQNASGENQQRIIKKLLPKYPEQERKRNEGGWADVTFTVAKDGTTRNHGLLSATSKYFAQAAITAIKSWRYKPAMVNGKPVDVYGDGTRIHFYIIGDKFNKTKVQQLIAKHRAEAEKGDAEIRYQFARLLDYLPTYTKIAVDYSEVTKWYWRAAQDGSRPAEYELGRRLLSGQGCRADSAKSLAWLQRAADQNVTDAQFLLAMEMLSGVRLAKDENSAMKWLEKAAALGSNNAKLKLAWVLSTDSERSRRNAGRALAYLDTMNPEYLDKLSIYETRAAAYAQAGNFDKAVEWQQRAQDEAQKYDLPETIEDERLAAYQQKKTWTETP